MTPSAYTPASPTKRALAPDTRRLDPRAARAWTEPMATAPIGGGLYTVDTDGGSYVVDLVERRCSCPDNSYRDERCKHLRRVALEITHGDLPAPGYERVACRSCGVSTTVREGHAALCRGCRFTAGQPVRDRETGDLLVVVEQTRRRADETPLGEGTVADHPTNDGYPRNAAVVECVYPFSGDPETPLAELKRYRFPHSRLTAETVSPDQRRVVRRAVERRQRDGAVQTTLP